MVLEMFKMWNQVGSRLQTTCDDSEFSCLAQSRQKIAAFGDQFSSFNSWLEARRTKTSHTSEDRGTIPMPTFATRPSTTSSTIQVELPQTCTVGQQRQQISELQFDMFPDPQSFLVWKVRFKTQVISCSDFPSDAMLWSKEVDMVDAVDEMKSSRSAHGKDFANFEMLDAKIPSALNKITQKIPSSRRRLASRSRKPKKEDRFLRGRQFAFMNYDYFPLTGAHEKELGYAELYSVTIHNVL